MNKKKIAVLLPKSDMFPTLALDFLNGLKFALKNEIANGDLEFLIESLGIATDRSLLKISEKLILQENIDLAISFCGSNILQELVTVFDNYKKPLVYADLGGSIIKDNYVKPYVLNYNLNLWQSAFVAAKYAVKKYGKRVAMVSSAYDGSYNMSAASVEGINAMGGEVVGYFVNQIDFKNSNYTNFIAEVEKVQADVIIASFSYNEGTEIFKALSKSSINGSIPILANPLMTNEISNTENYQIENVESVATWSFEDNEKAMKDFKKNYEIIYNQAPNIISLLGYEIGLTVIEVIDEEGRISPNLSEVIKNKKIYTPRGKVIYNHMNEAIVENMLLRNFQYTNGNYINTVAKKLDVLITEEIEQRLKTIPEPSWHNPYICT